MKIPIGALTRELISTHQWIFPVVNGKRIGHEMDVASIYLSHGIHPNSDNKCDSHGLA